LFATAGFAETTNKAIAEQAGVDVASINYHFGGRGGLYQATLIEAHRQLISLGELEAIDASELAPADKVGRIIDTLVDAAVNGKGWGMRLLVLQRILGEATGLPVGDPSLLRCLLSIVAPCLVLVVANIGMPGPAQLLRQMPKEVLSTHLRTFALAGLAAVSRQASS